MTRNKTAATAAPAGVRSARMSICLVIGFAAAWAVLEEVLGSKFEGRYDLLQVVWCRYAVHLAILLAIWGWREPAVLWRTRRPVFQLARSLLMFVMPFSFVLSLSAGTPAASVWAVFWFSPLFVLAFARTVLRERIPPIVWAATGLGTLCALVMLGPTLPSTGTGWVFALLMALSFSGYLVMTRSLRLEPLQANLFYTAFGVLVVLSPFVLRVWTPPSAHDALVFFGIGSVGLLALLALDRAMANAPVSVSAPALHLQVVFVLLIGHYGGGERFSPSLALAALVVVALVGYLFANAGRVAAGVAASDETSVLPVADAAPSMYVRK